MRHYLLLLGLLACHLSAQQRPSSCANCREWNAPQKPFRIYGNTYWVGPHGLGSILITSAAGNVLIDGALPESAPLIIANIRALGFRIEDVKLILNSHVHFDHAGGIAELQRRSGARAAASAWSAEAMKTGAVPHDDPQYGSIVPIARVARVETLKNGETLTAGAVTVTAHLTPGHTPGGTSWTWRSCEGSRCLNMVYADSLSPVSAKGYRFTQSKAVSDFERSYKFLENVPCDILITPHPDPSDLWGRLGRRAAHPDALIDSGACKALAQHFRESLKERLATESGR